VICATLMDCNSSVHRDDSDGILDDASHGVSSFKDSLKAEKVELSWAEEQLVLRNQILIGLENNILKESFLQEFYIRRVARVNSDTVYVAIGFNLHGNDCGAPDCYQTDLRFHIKLGDSLQFPDSLPYKEREYGCIGDSSSVSGVFQLLDQSSEHLVYSSIKPRRTLVLYSSREECGNYALYFNSPNPDRIDAKNMDKLMKELEQGKDVDRYPYRSWALTTFEYGFFKR